MLYRFATLALAAASFRPSLVEGHGFLTSPRSRNWVAHDDINTCSGSGCPRREYCHHCLNLNDGVCGKTGGGNSYEADVWVDRDGQPMPWVSQTTYDAGQLIVVNSEMSTHHGGHMTLAYCVIGATDCSSPTDFPESNRLEFVQDMTEGGVTMPKDPLHPDRGYYSQWGSQMKFSMVYKLPDNVHGERVLLQWRYITANACLPPDYPAYFNTNTQIPNSYWKSELSSPNSACSEPYPNDGSRSSVHPEQFFNCAEVTILPSGTASPTPLPLPTTSSPTSSLSPTNAPVIGGPPPCLSKYQDCTYGTSSCCEGYKCVQVDSTGNNKCLADTCDEGPNPPPSPSNPPSPPPTAGNPPTGEPGVGCCSRDLGTCTHLDNSFCNADKENCEGPCGKVWLPSGDISDTCLPLWEKECATDSDCCLWGHCSAVGSCDHDGTWKPPTDFTNSPTSRVTPEPTDQPTTPLPTSDPTTPTPSKTPTPRPSNEPSTASSHGEAFPNIYSDAIRVNQIGYLRFATKIGVIVTSASNSLNWQIQDGSGSVVLSGSTTPYGFDGASEDSVHQADFSSLENLGSYKLVVDGIGSSLAFNIAPSLYPNLPHEAMNYFYFHRMGSEDILAEHLIDERYARIALHPEDTAVPPYPGWCSGCEDFDLLGSWADAGDFGIYTVNHAISAWTLLNLHELFPEAFTDGELNIPESGNSIPDVLDEVDYGSRFVRGMLPSDGGLASHKAHNHAWSAFTITIEAENSQNGAGTRSAMGSSTPATFAVARVNAQLARMWHTQGNDAAYVTVLWDAAEDAWDRAFGTSKTYNPSEASPGPAVGGGDYPDSQISDDEYAAACEMYLTAHALGLTSDAASYKSIVTSSGHFGQIDQWDWGTVTGAGTLSLYAVDNDLSESHKGTIENSIVGFADKIKQAIDQEGYPSNLNFSESSQYPWGSNSFIVNRMIVLAYAHEITGDISYQKYLLRSMDYVMGTNAMDISYVTGYGEKAETDTHDRWAWTIGQDSYWPRGWLSGGPNNELVNDYETPGGVAAAKSYAARGTAPHAWGSKENTVNWNSPLAWVAWYIEHKIVPQLGGCGGNCAPVAESYSVKLQMDGSVSLTLRASDYDGSISSWAITEQPKLGSLSGTAPNLVYTPNSNTKGTDTFSFIVIDNSGQSSGAAKMTLTIRDCNYLDIFQVPSNYPPLTVSYNYVHVSEDGPNFGNTRTPFHKVQVNTNMDQFVMEFDESPYYLDLKQCMSASTVSSPAFISLSGCGISGLDGVYWIRQDNGNSIWVEKNNAWAIVFTNDANFEPEFCRSDGPPSSVSGVPTARPSPETTMAPVTPSPTDSSPSTNRPTSDPTRKPTKVPSANPTPDSTLKPTTGSNSCCTNRNLGYQTCDTNSWCNQSESNCNTCGGVVMAVPLKRDGCCTWGGNCSGSNPDNNMGCQYMQSNCEDDCGGTWQFF